MSTLLSPQGYQPGLIGNVLPVTDPSIVWDPPLLPDTYTGGFPPDAAWNISFPEPTWANWSASIVLDHYPGWAFTSTPGASLSYSFLGTDWYILGNFSGQSSNVINGTLQLTVDGNVLDLNGTQPNAAVPPGTPWTEGFGQSYGSQLPGSIGMVANLDYTWHTIELELREGWLNVTSIEANRPAGVQGASLSFNTTQFLTSDTSSPTVPDTYISSGTWDVVQLYDEDGPSDEILMTNVTGSSFTYPVLANTTYFEIRGYIGPDSGDYSVTLRDISTWPSEGTISWYGQAADGTPITSYLNAKTQWPISGFNVFNANVDQSRLYNVTVTFRGSEGQRFGLENAQFYVQGPYEGIGVVHHTTVGRIVAGVVGGLGALVCLGILWWWWRRRKSGQRQTKVVDPDEPPPPYHSESREGQDRDLIPLSVLHPRSDQGEQQQAPPTYKLQRQEEA